MTDTAKLREARIALTAEMLHGFVARFADTEPFFDNLKPEARARYFKEAVRFLEELDDALLESLDIILIRRDAEGNWPEWAIEQAFAIIESLTEPRYVIFSEWQLGGSEHFAEIDDALSESLAKAPE